MKSKKGKEGISVPNVDSDDMQVLRDNYINFSEFIRAQVKIKADYLRGLK